MIELVVLAAVFGVVVVAGMVLMVRSRRYAYLDWSKGGPPGAGHMIGGGNNIVG